MASNQYTDSKLKTEPNGGFAEGVPAGAIYNQTPPTLTDGQLTALQTDGAANIKTTLATAIAGEDLVNNVLVGASKTVTTQTQTNTSLINAGSNSSTSVASSIYRKYRAFGAGQNGNFDLKLEVSPDNGVSGWYYINDAGANQYPVISGDLVAPYVRITVTNQYAGTQTINAWLVLST